MDIIHESPSTIDEEASTQNSPVHEAVFLSLPYFTVRELLAASETCRSLRDAVKNDDVIPWLNVVVEWPLSDRLTDESLARIASMARGKLRTLSLFGCKKITDDGLQRVIDKNPLIDKLLVPECTALTPEGVLRAVRTLSSKQGHTLKKLHINGLYNIQKHHIQILHSYLQLNTSQQRPKHPIWFHNFATLTRHKHFAVTDVEICPRCDEPRVVFSCTRKTCLLKFERPNLREHCRGCGTCIPRCKECGICVNESEELEEVICADILCLDCWLRLPKCSFCNKAYCKQHAEEKKSHFSSSESGGFICDVCNAKFVECLYKQEE